MEKWEPKTVYKEGYLIETSEILKKNFVYSKLIFKLWVFDNR